MKLMLSDYMGVTRVQRANMRPEVPCTLSRLGGLAWSQSMTAYCRIDAESDESFWRLRHQGRDDDSTVPPPGLVCSARLGKGPVLL